MLNSLDLLVILFLVSAVATLLAVCLLWLVKKPLVRRICLVFLTAAALYFAAMGAYIGRFVFLGQHLPKYHEDLQYQPSLSCHNLFEYLKGGLL